MVERDRVRIKGGSQMATLKRGENEPYVESTMHLECTACGEAWQTGHRCPVAAIRLPADDFLPAYIPATIGVSNTTNLIGPVRTPFRCPVCEGRTRVPSGFYGETKNASAEIICQTCHGAGVVWSPEG